MQDNSNSVNRYSDQELEEFKIHVEQKLSSSIDQLNSLKERVDNISEMNGNDGDWMDDSSNAQDIALLNSMMNRQQKHIRDLENALIRIRNKRYGICIITGELIDKRRLMAVPTTTKSLAAKSTSPSQLLKKEVERKKSQSSNAITSFSRIIKRTGGNQPTPNDQKVKEDEFNFEEELGKINENDLDTLNDESLVED